MLKNLAVEEAQQLLLEHIKTLPRENVCLTNSLHRILGEEVTAPFNVPNFDKSPLDGYAILATDTETATQDNPIKLKIIGSIAAGEVFHAPVHRGETVRIMTGAPMPTNTDCVIKQEDITLSSGYIEIYKKLRPFSNYVKAGEDIKINDSVLKAGTEINSKNIGILASLGKRNVEVFKKPKVAILSTGSELLSLEEDLLQGKIYNSNLYSITGSIVETKGEPYILGTVTDDLDLIAEKMEEGLLHSDLVLSTGGASVGDFDLIGQAYEKIGAELLFWKITAKPGTPVLAAKKNGKLLVGLSGNPAAAYICFETLVRPLILKLGGYRSLFRTKIKGTMAEEFNKKGDTRRFVRATALYENSGYHLYLSGKQNPGVLKSMLNCNALIDILPEQLPLQKGDLVDVLLLF